MERLVLQELCVLNPANKMPVFFISIMDSSKSTLKQSFSTPGNPYDHSVCESFFRTLKKESLYRRLYETPQELTEVSEEYIELYNGRQPHRKRNMKTPIQYEAEFFSVACK